MAIKRYNRMMLDGIRVLDLSQNIAGPQCALVLGDLGADVIKVEPPSGDPARAWGPPFWGNDSSLYLAFNRNKRSIVLDLKTDEGLEVVQRLIASSDIVIQAFRKGVAERFGIGYEQVKQKHPKIIYASLTGYGSEGPYANLPGYDPLLQAFSGIMSVTGHEDSPPARVGGAVVDIGSGNFMAIGILAALRKRDREGVGTHIECSLLDTALSWISYHMVGYLASGDVPQRMGTGLVMVAPYEGFPTEDGELVICGGNDGIFGRLCDALDTPEWANDDRFRDNPSRVSHRDELRELLSAKTRQFTTAALDELLKSHRVPCSPIQTVDQVVDHPQVRSNKIFEPEPHPRIPGYRDLKLPIRFDGARPDLRELPPEHGEHTDEILAEIGYPDSEADDGNVNKPR